MENSHISTLRARHQALKTKIRHELGRPLPDTFRISELKKQKLQLKEALNNS